MEDITIPKSISCTAVYIVEDRGETFCLMIPRFVDFFFEEWFRMKWLGHRFSPEAIHSIVYVETHNRFQEIYERTHEGSKRG